MATPVQIKLSKRPAGIPQDDVWETTNDAPRDLADGEIALDVQYLSIDPAMRGWMRDGRSYVPPVGIGEVMRAIGAGVVTASKADGFDEGDAVVGLTGVQTHYVGPSQGFNKVFPGLAPLPTFLAGLGMPGMTAYFGLLDVGQLKDGETVLVSAAAGAVGGIVGQIAKIKGCRVIGLAGGKEKCDAVINEYGFDDCIDYKAGDVGAAIKKACPDRIDVYFDNVGGEILDAALNNIAMNGRIVVCGAISQYNEVKAPAGPANYLQLLVQRARMEGLVVFDYQKRFPEAAMQMAGWAQEGKLKFKEHVVEGIENFPDALRMLFEGRNHGKLVVKI